MSRGDQVASAGELIATSSAIEAAVTGVGWQAR